MSIVRAWRPAGRGRVLGPGNRCSGLFRWARHSATAAVRSAALWTTRAASSARSSLDHVAKILRIGAEEHGRPVAGRLDHVLAAAIAEAAADKGHVGQAPTGGQLAQRVQEEHGRRALANSPRGRAELRRTSGRPRDSISRATSSKRSLCRGTRISRRAGKRERTARYASIAAASSLSCVLPATKTGSDSPMPKAARSSSVFGLRRSVSTRSNLIEPVIESCCRAGAQFEKPLRVGRILHGDRSAGCPRDATPAAAAGGSHEGFVRSDGR